MIITPVICNAQGERYVMNRYLTKLPSFQRTQTGTIPKMRMTAVYVNMDKLGNISGLIKVTGDYTSGIEGDLLFSYF